MVIVASTTGEDHVPAPHSVGLGDIEGLAKHKNFSADFKIMCFIHPYLWSGNIESRAKISTLKNIYKYRSNIYKTEEKLMSFYESLSVESLVCAIIQTA